MTDQEELRELMTKVQSLGARVYVRYDTLSAQKGRGDAVAAVRILGMPGCGPFMMAAVAAAERMRMLVAEDLPAISPLPVRRAGAQRLLDSVWTTEFVDYQDGSVTLLSYTRENPLGYEKEKELPLVVPEETEGRMVEAIRIYDVDAYQAGYRSGVAKEENSTLLNVRNPGYVFSYKEMIWPHAGSEVEFEPAPAEDASLTLSP